MHSQQLEGVVVQVFVNFDCHQTRPIDRLNDAGRSLYMYFDTHSVVDFIARRYPSTEYALE